MSNYDHNTLVDWLSQNSTNFDVAKLTYGNNLADLNIHNYTSFYSYDGSLELTSVKDFPEHILLASFIFVIDKNFDQTEEVNWPLDILYPIVGFEITSEKIKKFNLIQKNLKTSVNTNAFCFSLYKTDLKEITATQLMYISDLFICDSAADIKFSNILLVTVKNENVTDPNYYSHNMIVLDKVKSLNIENLTFSEPGSSIILSISEYTGYNLDFIRKITENAKVELLLDAAHLNENKEYLDKLINYLGKTKLEYLNIKNANAGGTLSFSAEKLGEITLESVLETL